MSQPTQKKTNTKASLPPQTLVLLDTHAILHRAFHAVPDLVSSVGMPTGALYGLLNMILKTVKDLNPDYIIACYDLPQPTFRHITYDNYKKGRKQTDDILKAQIDESRNIFQALNIPIYESVGFEADDMLGTIVEQVKNNPTLRTVIVSGDMDTLQLVINDQVSVYTMKKGLHDTIVYNESLVRDRFGFGPELIPDYKGLRGDPSDNIIGVPGIGEKTATELILHFGTIEEMYQTLKKAQKNLLDQGIKQRIIDLLIKHEEDALFSKTLATIRRDAPIAFALPEKTFKESYSVTSVTTLLREYEIRALVGRFENLFIDKTITPTESSDTFDSISKKTEPSENQEKNHQKTLETSIALWLLNSDLGHPSYEEILQETQTTNLDDAYGVIEKKLIEKNLLSVFEKIERPLIPVVARMTEHGVLIDKKFLTQLSKDYHKKLDVLSGDILQFSKTVFNINSPKQLAEFLFTELGLKPKGKKSKTGTYSTKSEVLEGLLDDHEVIQKIIDYRELQKLLSTYIDNLPTLLDEGNRLHAQFLQHGTTTGRFSSQNPNLQNIPIRSELGRAIRKAFIAPKGSQLVAADYSQIELRILAMLSQDQLLIDVFRTGRDIHTAVASRIFHINESQVTKNQRRNAKIINFGILYGMGISALQKNLGGTRAEAEQFYEAYFTEFPSIKEYIESIKRNAGESLETRTVFGRVRNFPMFRSKLPFMIALAERTAVNAPIQGTNADIIKLAMVDIETIIINNGWIEKVFPVLQIHDELVYEVSDELVDEFSKIISSTMESVITRHYGLIWKPELYALDIPITVSVEIGQNIGTMVEQ
jgi:DNA polymerase-1